MLLLLSPLRRAGQGQQVAGVKGEVGRQKGIAIQVEGPREQLVQQVCGGGDAPSRLAKLNPGQARHAPAPITRSNVKAGAGLRVEAGRGPAPGSEAARVMQAPAPLRTLRWRGFQLNHVDTVLAAAFGTHEQGGGHKKVSRPRAAVLQSAGLFTEVKAD